MCCGAENKSPLPSSILKPLPLLTGKYPQLAAAESNQPFMDMTHTESQRMISMKKAMLLSILLPGAGEYYAGGKFKGQVFMGVEAAIWSAFAGFRIYGGWKKDDYRSFAAAHAGVDNDGKSDEFYDWVGFYDSRDEFNEIGRLYYPERDYIIDTPAYYWQWDSETNQSRFKDIKDDSKTAFRNSTFMLGLALLNRVISGIDTYRTVKAAGQKVNSMSQFGEYKLKISPRLSGDNPGIKLALSRKF